MSVAHCRGSDRAILTLPGCIDSIAAEDVPPVLLTQTRHLHIASFYILKKMWPGWRSVISAVKASGGTVSLDTNYDPEERWDIPELMDILPMVDIFFPNETELCSIMHESDPMTALERASGIVPVCVMKCGGRGAVAAADGRRKRSGSPIPSAQETRLTRASCLDISMTWAYSGAGRSRRSAAQEM